MTEDLPAVAQPTLGIELSISHNHQFSNNGIIMIVLESGDFLLGKNASSMYPKMGLQEYVPVQKTNSEVKN